MADRQSDSDSGAGGQLRQSARQDDNALLLQDQREDPRRAELEQNLQSLERDLEEQEGKVAKKRARGVTAGWLAPDTKRVSILKKLIAITDNALKKLEPAKPSQSSAELQLSESGKSVENSRNKKLDNYRTNDKINAEGPAQQSVVNQVENVKAQNETLTAQDLLDRIDEFVDVRTLSGKQQNTLDAYNQQKQLLSDLEASRKTHENPDELDSQIAKAKEKLQKIQERKVTKSIVNRAKQSIYHEYAGEAIKRAHLQKRLASQQAVLDELYARLNSIKTIDAETISPENMEIQDEIAEQEWLLDDIKDKLVNTERSLTVAKSRASAIVDSNDRGVLLFDDRSILEVGGKYVVVFNELFDPDYVDKKGRTNLDRLRLGLAPIGYDNKSINIAHLFKKDK